MRLANLVESILTVSLNTLNVLRCQSHAEELFYYQWPGFHHIFLLTILHGR